MLIDYIKDGTIPEGFYVKTTKNGMIQFRRIKENNKDSLIQKYEEKIKKLKSEVNNTKEVKEQ